MRLHVLAAAVAAALPAHGTVVPGKSLGGVRLGDSSERVVALWGRRFGVCKDCRRRTWYYTYARYQPQGAGVEFRRNRVVGLFTLWSPTGWQTSRGLRIGDPAAKVTSLYGPLTKVGCGTYDAYLLPNGRTLAAFYVFNEQVWGFGVSLQAVPACR